MRSHLADSRRPHVIIATDLNEVHVLLSSVTEIFITFKFILKIHKSPSLCNWSKAQGGNQSLLFLSARPLVMAPLKTNRRNFLISNLHLKMSSVRADAHTKAKPDQELSTKNRSLLKPVIGEHIFIGQNLDPSVEKRFHCFSTLGQLQYHPMCEDFGPMNLSCVIRFTERLDDEIQSHPSSKIVYSVEVGRRALSNAIFLLGSYLILRRGKKAQDVVQIFDWVDETWAEPFRDATFSEPDFDLMLADCWRGFERGHVLGWISASSPDQPGQWGQYDVDEYEHYDDPLNGDLHIVVPGKIKSIGAMMMGPLKQSKPA
jgi:hypothetical protein